MWIKFLGRMLGGILLMAAFLSANRANAQDSNVNTYLGPGIISRGVGDVGMRSGEQVDLKFYVGVSGVVDTNLQPFQLDAKGNLLRIHNLYGIDGSWGVYGVHHWKKSQLGIDYGGDYRRYFNSKTYNGSDQRLNLGYTVTPTRRWSIDLRESAGTVAISTSQYATTSSENGNAVVTPSTMFFDARTTFLDSAAYATYLESARTSFTFGGSGFLQDQKAAGLYNSGGYNFTGSMQHRVTKSATVGASYTYSHYEFPAFHSNSDSNTYQGTFATGIGRSWTFSLQAGVTISEVNSQQTFTLDPVLAALFGVPTITQRIYVRSLYPSGVASLDRKFRRAELSFNYSRGVNAGNGASGTSRQEYANMTFSYTGIRKLNLGFNGGHSTLTSIGQDSGSFATFTGAFGFAYTVGRGVSITGRYGLNQQQADIASYRRTSTGATLGLMFSPGAVPLALW